MILQNPIIIYLLAAFIVSLVNAVILTRIHTRGDSYFYPSIFYTIALANGGYLFLALSTNIEEALLANKIVFVAGAFLPFFMYLGLLNLCKVKIGNVLQVPLLALSSIMYLLGASAGYTDFFYKNAHFIAKNGIGGFEANYGTGYIIFTIVILIYATAFLSTVFIAFLQKKNVSYHSLASLIFIGSTLFLSYDLSKNIGIDAIVMPAVFIISEIILLTIIHRMGKYDLESTVFDSLVQNNTNAYITFSKSKRYIGCNDIAKKFFPEVENFRIDYPLEESTLTAKTFLKLINQFGPKDLSKIIYFPFGNNHYKCLIRHLFHGRQDCGYLMRIEDDTKQQRYINLLDKYNSELTKYNSNLRKNNSELAKYNTELTNDLKSKDSHILAIQEQMIVGMAHMVENRDSNTGSHIWRTSQVIRILISEMRKDPNLGLSAKFCRAVIKAAPMHDLGKIAVDDTILRKPGKFTNEEYNIMKTHAEKGAAIVENLLKDIEDPELVTIAKNIANYHHEFWNGSGYPKHLQGTEIPFEARIMAIADVYDALVSQRCYKEKISCNDAYDIIINSMGTHFDPNLKTYFINCREELEKYYNSALADQTKEDIFETDQDKDETSLSDADKDNLLAVATHQA